MGAVEKLREVVTNRHRYAREWKAGTGGQVIGWFCTYVPEEIIYAAGMLPVRILGSHETEDITGAYMPSIYCPFSRDVLAQGLKGRYDYLNGIVKARSCLHMRMTYTLWKQLVPIDFTYYIYMPTHALNPQAKPFLANEYADFKEALEKWGGVRITSDDLDRAIEVYNRNRSLIKKVYEFRKADNPAITGAEALEMVLAGQLMDKEEHNKLLEQLLEELPNRAVSRETVARLMLVGSEMDDVDFIRTTEELGATFVIEDHCTGTRYFWNEVIPEEDRLAAIAARYIDRQPCPSKDWSEHYRFPTILEFARDYNVQGVLLHQQKFCDTNAFDVPALQRMFDGEGIPTIFLEFDMTVPFGQFRTRIEAFLEMLRPGVT
ncbi:MAG: 2-hydroxyacyl-CoA dehydratase [Dehalococcoidia bacterium]|nr:MAG: 2-hydroxyacyl-CoA dehydratase [Dehalococcoidia bacterium]